MSIMSLISYRIQTQMQASRAAFLSAKDRRREQLAQRMMLSPNTGIVSECVSIVNTTLFVQQVAPKRLVIAYREGRLDELAATFGYVEPMRFVHVPMIEIVSFGRVAYRKIIDYLICRHPRIKKVMLMLSRRSRSPPTMCSIPNSKPCLCCCTNSSKKYYE